MKTHTLFEEAMSLPVKDRTMLVDSLLQSLNPADSDIEDKWVATAKKRLSEIQAGKIKPIPGKEVFNSIQNHFDK